MVTRRQFSAGLAAVGGTLFTPKIARAQTRELRIFTWEGYAEPALVEKFQSENDCKLNISYTGSVDEMFAKMQGSKGADFDIVSFDPSSVSRYINLDLILPLDLSLLPNRKNLIPVFLNQPALEAREKLWAVPHAWGSLPLIYSLADFPTPPESWSVLWDPQYARQVIALDDANNNISLAAVILGLKNPFNLSDAEFDQVRAKLIEIKRNLLTYFAGYDEGVSIFANNGVKAMFAMGEPQMHSLKKLGVDVALTIPKEGGIGWIDCQSISVGARDPILAHKWINECAKPYVGKIMSEFGYGNVLDQSLNEAAGMTYADRLTFFETPEDFERRVRVWNEVKAA